MSGGGRRRAGAVDTRTMAKNVVAFAVSQQIGSVSPNASSPAFSVPS